MVRRASSTRPWKRAVRDHGERRRTVRAEGVDLVIGLLAMWSSARTSRRAPSSTASTCPDERGARCDVGPLLMLVPTAQALVITNTDGVSGSDHELVSFCGRSASSLLAENIKGYRIPYRRLRPTGFCEKSPEDADGHVLRR